MLSKIVVGCLLLAGSIAAQAEESPKESCNNASTLYTEGDLEGALEEARWCVKQMEQEKQNNTAQYFKDSINGYAGGELSQQQMMGITVIERKYTKGSVSINVGLSGGASGAMAGAFSAMLGMQQGQGKAIRIQRRSANDVGSNGRTDIQVTLKSGGILSFKSRGAGRDEVVAFAKAFPVADLDDSRK